jgi:hypothetical protein
LANFFTAILVPLVASSLCVGLNAKKFAVRDAYDGDKDHVLPPYA